MTTRKLDQLKIQYIILSVGALIATSNYVQAQINAPVEYTVKLTGPELDIIGKGLGTQPFNEAAPLLQKLREQIATQQSKPDDKKVDEKKP